MACAALFDLPLDMAADAIFSIVSTPEAVRDGLRAVLDHPSLQHLSACARGSTELVLAEILNNTVEHGYRDEMGQIELRIRTFADRLYCEVFDDGTPMPNHELPAGAAQDLGDDHDLPEGGFGWFLIRALTTDLTYRRIDARNHLSFLLNIEQ